MTFKALESPADIEAAAGLLQEIEPRFTKAIRQLEGIPLRRRAEGFDALLNAIVAQQVSVASANAIWARLCAAGFDQEQMVLKASHDDLRNCGLSNQKAIYAVELARAGIDWTGLSHVPDEEVIATLTKVKGIGRWTAEIYAMFSLGRTDVFAAGDLALQEAARILFELPERPTEEDLRAMAGAWSPVRAVAARVLWAYYRVQKNREGITT